MLPGGYLGVLRLHKPSNSLLVPPGPRLSLKPSETFETMLWLISRLGEQSLRGSRHPRSKNIFTLAINYVLYRQRAHELRWSHHSIKRPQLITIESNERFLLLFFAFIFSFDIDFFLLVEVLFIGSDLWLSDRSLFMNRCSASIFCNETIDYWSDVRIGVRVRFSLRRILSEFNFQSLKRIDSYVELIGIANPIN